MIKKNTLWTNQTKHLIGSLHNELILNNNNWHTFKTNKYRRSAELIASALSQIINGGEDKDIEDLLEQAQKWIKEIGIALERRQGERT